MALKLTSNSTARMSSVLAIDWAHITGKPAELGISNLASTGLVVATDLLGDFTGRILTGTANQITVTNGDGILGNPTLSFPTALTLTGKTITGGTYTSVVSINGNFWTAGTGTLTIGTGKTLTANNTLTLAGTDSTTMTFPTTSATIARTDAANTFTGHQTIEGVTSTGATGTGRFVFDGTPTLVTPVLGVATATSINGNTFTTGTYTLTGTAGKTLNFSNTLTLAGVDSTTITFQGTDTYVGKATTDIFTNKTFDTAGTGNSFKINGTAITSNTGTTAVNVLQQAPTINNPNIVGTTTNDSASAGSIGEVISSTVLVAAANALSTGTLANLTTVTLTPGDWDVNGSGSFTGPATTALTFAESSLSTTSATRDFTPERYNGQFYNSLTVFANVNPAQPTGPTRFSISTTTTVFLIARANFATSTCSAFGTIRARRER